jgi:glyoxylase-like metal-dependent hydrolase (beta-lactamase superfamily II)
MRLLRSHAFYTALLFLLPVFADAQSVTNPADPQLTSYETVKVAEGVYAFISPEPKVPLVTGNSTVIIGNDAALVVDSGHFPSLTRHQIDDIRRLTGKPVAFVVNTHWHADHNTGNYVYREQFPAVSIIGTPATQHELANPIPQYDDVKQLTEAIPFLEKMVADGKRPNGKPLSNDDLEYYKLVLADAKYVLPQFQQAKRVPPNITFDRRMMIDLGGRTVEIAFLGRGNTAGDAVVYVPDAKVLVTGDLLVGPTPYAIGSFIDEWIATMKALAAYDASVIIPGHGSVQHDKQYMLLETQALESLSQQAHQAVKQGQTQEQFQKSLNLTEFRDKMAANDPSRQRVFDQYFVAPGSVRAYREAKEGPLKDEN